MTQDTMRQPILALVAQDFPFAVLARGSEPGDCEFRLIVHTTGAESPRGQLRAYPPT